MRLVGGLGLHLLDVLWRTGEASLACIFWMSYGATEASLGAPCLATLANISWMSYGAPRGHLKVRRVWQLKLASHGHRMACRVGAFRARLFLFMFECFLLVERTFLRISLLLPMSLYPQVVGFTRVILMTENL